MQSIHPQNADRTVNPNTGEVTYSRRYAGDGLVPSAISRHEQLAPLPTIEIFAGVMQVTHPTIEASETSRLYNPKPKTSKVSKRGKVTGFSNKSRSRLLRESAKIREFFGKQAPLFITLTYPGKDVVGHSKEKWGRDLDVFRKRLNRWFTDHNLQEPSALWRKEFKHRKSGELEGVAVPHFHIILFSGLSYELAQVLGFKDFISRAWWEVVGSGDADHLKAGTNLEPLNSKSKARFYVSKYIAKVEEMLDIDTGRMWGVWGNIDKSPSMVITITERQFLALRRFFRKYLDKKGRRYYSNVLRRRKCGFSILGVGDGNDLDAFNFAVRIVMGLDRL